MHEPIFFIGCEPMTRALSEFDFDEGIFTALEYRNGVDYISFDTPRNESAKSILAEEIGFEVEEIPVENSNVMTLKVVYDEKKFASWINNLISSVLERDDIPVGKGFFETYKNIISTKFSFDYPVVLTIGGIYDSLLDYFTSKWYAPKDGDIFYVQTFDCHV